MAQGLAGVLFVVTSLILTAVPAHAETETVRDAYNRSEPAQNLKRVTFSYRDDSAVIHIKMERLSRQKTVLVSKYLRRDGVTIQVVTKYIRGNKRILVNSYDDTSFDSLSAKYAEAVWDFGRDVVRISIDQELLRGQRASFLAWSQEKDAMHGSPVGDFVSVTNLRRG